jgi:hypothetical protein
MNDENTKNKDLRLQLILCLLEKRLAWAEQNTGG